jgi:hypothetical protein
MILIEVLCFFTGEYQTQTVAAPACNSSAVSFHTTLAAKVVSVFHLQSGLKRFFIFSFRQFVPEERGNFRFRSPSLYH